MMTVQTKYMYINKATIQLVHIYTL